MIDKPIVTILIFSHPTLGYNKCDIRFPIDLTKKYPRNGSGLCNQIFKVINAIDGCKAEQNFIYFDVFSKDYFTGDVCELGKILDLEEMRLRYKFKIYDITNLRPQSYYLNNDEYVFRTYHQDPVKFGEISKKLIFNQKFEKTSNVIIEKYGLNNQKVNLVHMRIDSDYKQHVIGNKDLNHNPSEEYWNKRIEAYDELVNRYKNSIITNCDKSIPLVLLMEQTDHPLVLELKKDYEIIFFDKKTVSEIFKQENHTEIEGRELFALVDLLIGKNLNIENFIGLETETPLCDGGMHNSTFTILLKHTSNYKKYIQI
jgi:hypothetical protein